MSAGLLDSARNVLAGVLDLGRTRFELFGTELREELSRLAAAIIGGLAIVVLGSIGLGFGAVALIFIAAAALAAWQVYRLAAGKPRPFEATLGELQRDLSALRQ